MLKTEDTSPTARKPHDPGSDSESALLWEALCRGAQHADLKKLLTAHENQQMPSTAELGMGIRVPMTKDFIDLHREYKATSAEHAYDFRVATEFAGLTNDVKESFWYDENSSDVAAHKLADSDYANRYYSEMRVAYYTNGYSDPVGKILSKIRTYKFLGKPVLLHEIAGKRLPEVESSLSDVPGLVANLSRRIRLIGGFVPRFIAPREGRKGQKILSNHAFGLAIDLQWDSNPHIKDADVIRVIKEITGFDFGKPLAPQFRPLPYLGIATKYAAVMSEGERLKETCRLAHIASVRFQDWLEQNLPLVPKYYEWLLAAKVVHPFPIDDATAIAFTRLSVLLKHYKPQVLHNWMKEGIQTLPFWFIARMAEGGFQWGGMYRDTKDFMHFELDPYPQNVIKPDSPKRPLSEVFDRPRDSAVHSLTRHRGAKYDERR